jgi:hypothetical protein
MRMLSALLVFIALSSAAYAANNSAKGAVDYNGVKDRYDCIHLGGHWHPLTQRCTKTV